MFDFIKLLLVNRVKILACIRLKRAQSDEEKRNIEADLLADPSGEGAMILKQLHSNASAENWTKDRMSQMASKARREAKQLNHVKSVKESGTFVEEVDVAVVSGGDAEGAIELDLESLAFKEGAHLMSNKKVTLYTCSKIWPNLCVPPVGPTVLSSNPNETCTMTNSPLYSSR